MADILADLIIDWPNVDFFLNFLLQYMAVVLETVVWKLVVERLGDFKQSKDGESLLEGQHS